jgi:hypothetical protein
MTLSQPEKLVAADPPGKAIATAGVWKKDISTNAAVP